MNLTVATIRSSGHQAVALRAPRLPAFSYWVAKLRIGRSAAVLMIFFCSESNGGDGSEAFVMNLLPHKIRKMH